MKYVITAAVMALAIAATASAAYPTKPNHLRGPICANRHTGVMRWVKATQPCKKHEVRLMVPGSDRTPAGIPGTPGPSGAQGPQGVSGPKGAAGAKGDTGARGETGSPGETGPAGEAGATGPAGQDGTAGAPGKDGATGPQGQTGAQGPSGATGAQGPKGDPGAQGPAGPAGPAGQNGLGTAEVYACVNANGGSWKWGGSVDGDPDCNAGHDDQILKVVIDTTP
ncbi:MAG TPA: hypothetical protein VH297_13090 [Gaiellaceae bacterium]